MVCSITLISNDETFATLCREILEERFGTEWELVTGPSGTGSPPDCCIWDFTPGETSVPPELESTGPGKHWILAEPKDVTALWAILGNRDVNVVAKPVSRATLRALFDGCKPQRKEGVGDSNGVANTLRSERDQMLQLLIQANLKLQESAQERNNFLARSVHDLRAPLTAISGYCGLLLEEELGPLTQEQRRVLKRMQLSATRLSRVSNGMFQLTVPRDAEQKLNLEKGDLRDCLDQALQEAASVLEDKRISVTADIEPAPEGLLFEKTLMTEAFVNLLDNVSKFTSRDGAIEIRGYSSFWERRISQPAAFDTTFERRVRQVTAANSYRVDIRDSGPGIPAPHVDQVFEEYTSYGGGQDRSGGGLGLAICRMILHRHQGRIWAESNPLGAVFSFVLPLQRPVVRSSAGESRAEVGSLIGKVGH